MSLLLMIKEEMITFKSLFLSSRFLGLSSIYLFLCHCSSNENVFFILHFKYILIPNCILNHCIENLTVNSFYSRALLRQSHKIWVSLEYVFKSRVFFDVSLHCQNVVNVWNTLDILLWNLNFIISRCDQRMRLQDFKYSFKDSKFTSDICSHILVRDHFVLYALEIFAQNL